MLGGPSVTTLEVSIYHAVRFSYDLPLAAILSVVQIFICSAIILLSKPLPFNVVARVQKNRAVILRNDNTFFIYPF